MRIEGGTTIRKISAAAAGGRQQISPCAICDAAGSIFFRNQIGAGQHDDFRCCTQIVQAQNSLGIAVAQQGRIDPGVRQGGMRLLAGDPTLIVPFGVPNPRL